MRARISHLLPEDRHAETEQWWYERQQREGELEQGSAECEWQRQLRLQQQGKERQQLTRRLRFVALDERAQRLGVVQLLRVHERKARHWPRHDVARFDAGRARLAHW